MRARAAVLAILAVGLVTVGPSKAAPGKGAAKIPLPPRAMGMADAKAAAVATELTNAMGGQRTWDVLPYFRFDFVVVREGKEVARFRHWWDKRNMRCRVEGPDEKGRIVTAIFSLKDKKGKSFTDGIVDTDPKNTADIIENGYARWVNDTYWIIMPFKLRDPGAHLQYGGLRKGTTGQVYDVLKLSFDPGIGLTPKDHYTLYINRKTHLIDRWQMMLQDQKPPPAAASWTGWTQVGPVKLATMHQMEGKPVQIRFDNVAAPPTMDESIFQNAHVSS